MHDYFLKDMSVKHIAAVRPTDKVDDDVKIHMYMKYIV